MNFYTVGKLLILFSFTQIAWAEPSPELIYNLKGTIVKVHTVTKSGRQGSGSGVVVAENLVATNCHVLIDSAGSNISAMGETYSPVGIRADWKHDVCILRFEFLPLKPATFGDSNNLTYESPTFSVGFSGGPPKPLTAIGKIKALYSMDDSFIIRTSASFQMGASGSPLFDEQGNLIGMNTVKSPGPNGYFYSVPAKWIMAAIALPEADKVVQTDTPFWDVSLEKRPYWMQVVLPMQAGKWGDLLEVATAWLQKMPVEPEAIYYEALAQSKLGELDKAKSNLKHVLDINPRHTSSVLALAQIAESQGAQTELKDLSQKLSALDEDSLELLNPVAK
jgi:hypothetical protein